VGGGDHKAEPERPEVTVVVGIEEQCGNHTDQRCQHHCHRHLPPRHIAGGDGGRRGREGGREGGKEIKKITEYIICR